jgi:hypothetical protein
MLTVTHICGHTQLIRIDELWDRLEEKAAAENKPSPQERLGKTREEFIGAQVAFFQRNLCSACFSTEKDRDSTYGTQPKFELLI